MIVSVTGASSTDSNSTEYTVRQFTNGYSEMSINYCNSGPAVQKLILALEKTGMNASDYVIGSQNYFTEGVEQMVMDYQKAHNLSVTGVVDNKTLTSILNNDKTSDTVSSDTLTEEEVESMEEDDPHYGSFFNTENTKIGRSNEKDIKIVLGDNTIIKTIHNVYMRSVSTEFDTSGNPISETYEFIGQDLTESDEVNDSNKY